jgi:hypothetical protein
MRSVFESLVGEYLLSLRNGGSTREAASVEWQRSQQTKKSPEYRVRARTAYRRSESFGFRGGLLNRVEELEQKRCKHSGAADLSRLKAGFCSLDNHSGDEHPVHSTAPSQSELRGQEATFKILFIEYGAGEAPNSDCWRHLAERSDQFDVVAALLH